jgi:hypothetical protein
MTNSQRMIIFHLKVSLKGCRQVTVGSLINVTSDNEGRKMVLSSDSKSGREIMTRLRFQLNESKYIDVRDVCSKENNVTTEDLLNAVSWDPDAFVFII